MILLLSNLLNGSEPCSDIEPEGSRGQVRDDEHAVETQGWLLHLLCMDFWTMVDYHRTEISI